MTKKELSTLAQRFGASITQESNGVTHAIEVDAPDGFVFAGNGCHSIVASWGLGLESAQRDDVASVLSMGVVSCEDSGCEVCA
jgi:hypothetical protein